MCTYLMKLDKSHVTIAFFFINQYIRTNIRFCSFKNLRKYFIDYILDNFANDQDINMFLNVYYIHDTFDYNILQFY